jgi:hypothetical protein
MEFSGKGSWAEAPPHQTALARRVVEAAKDTALLECLRTGAAEWMQSADREAERLGKEIRRANRKANKQRGNAGNATRRPGEDAQGQIEFPVPLPDMATDAEKCAVLAAIHDHFPGDVKLGPKSEQVEAPTSHEMLTWDYVTKLGEHDAQWLNDFLEGLISEVGAGEPTRESDKPKKSKHSTQGRDAYLKLSAALTAHHKYAKDSCTNLEPIGSNKLSALADVSTGSASNFFRDKFGGHTKYKSLCRHPEKLRLALKILNQEFTPQLLYGAKPPGEGTHDD